MPSSHHRHEQDKTISSCLVCGVNRIGDKSRLFSIVRTAFRDWTKQFQNFPSLTDSDSLDLSPILFTPPIQSMMSSYLLTAVGIYFDQPTTEHASFHEHRTVSATEPFLLLDLKSGTICHRNCDTSTSAMDNSEIC